MKEFWQGLTTGQKTKYIVSGIGGILIIIFAILNWETTEVHFIFSKVKISKTLLIVLSLAGGFGLATLFDYRKFKKKDKEIRTLKSQLGPRKEEIAE